MDNGDLFQKVKELQLPLGKYALFGSAPMGIRGLKTCRDIDIIIKEGLWEQYREMGWKLKTMPHGSQYLLENNIELWKDWKPGEWDIAELINTAEIINGLPFVKLEYVLKWKKLSGRAKDLKDIKIIDNYLFHQN